MWIEVFRTGKFADSRGNEQSYSAETLDNIIAKFNSQVEFAGYTAPLVKGHPKSNDPAHGWIARLARRGNTMLAKLSGLSEEIIADIRQGRYKRISIALNHDLLLRHIGLLGAVQPAVQGLKAVEFEDGTALLYEMDTEFQTEFSETNDDEHLAILEENKQLRKEIAHYRRLQKSSTYKEFAEKFFAKNSYFARTDELIGKATELLLAADAQQDDVAEFSECNALSVQIIEFFDSLKPDYLLKNIRPANLPARDFQDFQGRQVDEERLILHNAANNLLIEFPEMSYEQAINQIAHS